MHAILVLPMLAWVLSFADWSERPRTGVVVVAAASYVAVACATAAANVAGIESGQMSPATIALFTAGVVLLFGTGMLALVAPRRPR
jgi:peptidoglycan/LPS O-acetylase OafA/YrhL